MTEKTKEELVEEIKLLQKMNIRRLMPPDKETEHVEFIRLLMAGRPPGRGKKQNTGAIEGNSASADNRSLRRRCDGQ
jgi:hypothetical protein